MTHDRLANIAVAVTAAMLATATVSFAVSGGGATDPVAEDLPVVLTVPAPTVPHVRSAQDPQPFGAPAGDQTFAMASAGPETFSPTPAGTPSPAPGTPAGSATTALSGVASSGPVASPDKKGTVSEHEGDEDEHEVVKPKVRETKPPEDAEDPEDPEDKPKPPEPVEEEH
jgi:hypothetical protein